MQTRKRKSVPYYFLVSALSLIGIGFLLAGMMMLNISISNGRFRFPYGPGRMGVSLWMLAIGLASVSILLTLVFRIYKSGFRPYYFLSSIICSLLSISFCILLYLSHDYGVWGHNLHLEPYSWIYYARPFLSAIFLVLVTLGILTFKYISFRRMPRVHR